MGCQVTLIRPKRFGDDRGWFTESYNKRNFLDWGISCEFVQDNHSRSVPTGTLRGLHFQTPPFAQAKLVRCISGAIFDVAVDIRSGSPTFGQWVGAELSEENGHQLFIPEGFAHGFVTLVQDTQVTYKVSQYYSPEHDAGLAWDDPDIGIAWPFPNGVGPTLSKKDEQQPNLKNIQDVFAYHGEPLRLIEVGHTS